MNNKQRLKIHQNVFQKIHLCTITHDNETIQEIIHLIKAWGFALNGSNGEASESEVKRTQDRILERLGEI
jgi:hypothetical protein